MKFVRFALFLLPLALLTAGCSTDSAQSAQNVDANGDAVSSVPWNKPESWESQGQLGAMQH
jgi:outer membrane biogenesis lipoprotein LolB